MIPTINHIKTLTYVIYRIYCTINNKSYIGKTTRTFQKRYSLKKWWNNIQNNPLKSTIKIYGHNSIKLEFLEWNLKTQENLNAREIFYSKSFDSLAPNGFNLKKCGQFNNGSKKTYTLRNPKDELITFTGLNKFCEENKWDFHCVHKLFHGKILYYKGWSLPTTPIEKIRIALERGNARNVTSFILKNPTDQLVFFTNAKKFARIYNFSYSQILSLINGHINIYKGWIKAETKREDLIPIYHSNIFLYNKNGEKIHITNEEKFCKDNNLSKRLFRRLVNKEIYEYKGLINPEGNKNGKIRFKKKYFLINPYNEIVSIINLKEFTARIGINYETFVLLANGKIKQYKNWKFHSFQFIN